MRALVRDLDARAPHPPQHLLRPPQGRPLAGPRPPGGARPGRLDARDRAGLRRGRERARRRRLQRAGPGAPPSPRRADLGELQGAPPGRRPRPLPRRAGVGLVRPAVRPAPRLRHPAGDPGADRPGPPRHRRRHLGQAAVGRPPLGSRRPAGRELVPAVARARAHPHLALRRAPQRRAPAPARRLHPPAGGRRPGGPRYLPAGRPDAQDGGELHQAGRPAGRRGDRRLGGGAAGAAAPRRPQDGRAGRAPLLLPRAPPAQALPQPHRDPGAVPQGGGAARGRARAHHQPPGARPSPPSSTTPRSR